LRDFFITTERGIHIRQPADSGSTPDLATEVSQFLRDFFYYKADRPAIKSEGSNKTAFRTWKWFSAEAIPDIQLVFEKLCQTVASG
jgi:hypothetical protein